MLYYLKKYWKINFVAIVFLLAACALQVVANLLLIQAFQSIIELNMWQFIYWISVLIGFFFLVILLEGVQNFFQSRAIRAMNNEVRRDMVATLLQKSHLEFHESTSGEYLSWFTNDVNQIENLAWNSFFQCIQLAATVVFSAVALLTLHWSLLIAALVTTVVMLLAPQIFNKRMGTLGENCAKQQAVATSNLKDLLAGYDVLRFFGRDERFLKESNHASDQIEASKCRLSVVKGFVGMGISIVNIICQMLINVLIGVLSIQGIIIQSALMGGGNLCGSFSGSLGGLATLLLSFSSVKPYFGKITVHANCKSATVKESIEPLNSAITMENVSFRYGNKPILTNLSVRFEAGKKYALTGPSGCGKSTLLKLLIGWLRDYSGTIEFDGKNAQNFTPEQLHQQMGYIEQDVFLFNTTIRDNITLGEEFSEEQLQKALRDSALAGDLLNLNNGLDTMVGEEGSNLSGGQKQRVALARALIHHRSILLVDEGTSALDKKNADIVEECLLVNPDLTLILVSHHLTPERKAQFDQVYEL